MGSNDIGLAVQVVTLSGTILHFCRRSRGRRCKTKTGLPSRAAAHEVTQRPLGLGCLRGWLTGPGGACIRV